MSESTKKNFSTMDPERLREVARMGQAALKASGKRRVFTSEEARNAALVGWARRRGAGDVTGK